MDKDKDQPKAAPDAESLEEPSSEGQNSETKKDGDKPNTSADKSDSGRPENSDPLSGVPDGSKSSPLNKLTSFSRLYLIMFVILIVIAGMAVLLTAGLSSKKQANNIPKATSLTSGQLSQIQGNTTLVGDPKQTLDIQGNAIFEGQSLFRGDVAAAQALKVGGTISGQSLNIGGTGNFNQLQVNQNISINGDSSVSGSQSVQKDLTVKGNGNFNGNLNANQLTVISLELTGDFITSQHFVTNGSIPSASAGGGLGAGGTVSVSGSDTAGTVNLNAGSGTAAGNLATINFSKKYSKTPHVVITPTGSSGAGLQYYVSRSTGSFTISSANAPTAGTSFSFDYIVID